MKKPHAWHNFALPTEALDQRVVLITGATGGLGSAVSRACAKAGATVILAGRNMQKLESLYDELDGYGLAQPAISPLNQDAASEHDYVEIATTIDAEFGRLDALVHTAADLGRLTPLASVDQIEWNRVMAVNLGSARLLSVACLQLLARASRSSLVFTLDHKQSAYWGAYGVSKAALRALCCMLADETEGKRVAPGIPQLAVNGYDPGPMRTNLRRRAFAGELPEEAPLPEERLGPLLALIVRDDPSMSGQCLHYSDCR